MNILDVQDNLKNFSEKQLINEMQMPSGNAPQFLVLSEITRRKRMRDQMNMQKAANEPTVAQEAVASAGVPAQGIMGMSEAMAPKAAMAQGGIGSVMSQPMKTQMPQSTPMPDQGVMAMASGGSTKTKIEERRMRNGKIGLFKGNTFLGTKQESGGLGSLAEKIGFGGKSNVLDSIKGALGFAEGGVIKAQNGLPLGLRQRNPGNIRPGAGFIGESGAEDGYAKFDSDAEGLRAIQKLLGTYGDKYGINTLRGFANRYAPPSDNNPTDSYIDFLSQKTGIDPDQEINLAEKGSDIIPAVVGFEQGQQPYSQAQIDRAIRAAGTDDPAKVSEILGQSLDDVLSSRGASTADLFQSDAEPNFMSAMAATPVSQSATATQGDQDNPIEIGTLFGKAVMSDDLGEYIVGEDGEPIYLDENQLAGVDRKAREEPKPEPTPLAEVLAKEEEKANADAAAAAAAAKTEDKKDDTTPPWVTPSTTPTQTPPASSNEPIKPPAPAAPKVESEASSLEAELLKLQGDMSKSREQDKWLSLAQAGLALMSSKEPTLMGALGEAGLSGLGAMKEAESRYQEGVIDLINARAKLKKTTPRLEDKDALKSVTDILSDPLADRTSDDYLEARRVYDIIMARNNYGRVNIPPQAAS